MKLSVESHIYIIYKPPKVSIKLIKQHSNVYMILLTIIFFK